MNLPLRYTAGGRRHTHPDALTGPDAVLPLLPSPIARRIVALKLLRHFQLVPPLPVWRLWLRSLWAPTPTEPGDITFVWPPGSDNVWEILDTAGNNNRFRRPTPTTPATSA